MLELSICPRNIRYGVLIAAYRWDSKIYIKDGKAIRGITSVMEWANGKIRRMISADSGEGQRMLKELGYEVKSNRN